MSTLTSHKAGEGSHSTPNPQAQSALFRLPAEIRLQIFALAVQCPPIPLALIATPNSRRLTLVTPGVGGPTVHSIRAQRLLSLPLTCAQAQAEALPLLYGNNTFLVGDEEVIPVFAQGVYAPWVRRLDFGWTRSRAPLPREPKKKKRFGGLLSRSEKTQKEEIWDEVWKAVASLENLQWIRLEICVPYTWTYEWKPREEELLSPLKGLLKKGAVGELTLTWEKVGAPGANAEDFLPEWSIIRRPWGAGSDEFPTP